VTPFDHIKNLHTKKVKWEDLNEEERKTFNVFIVHRGLSMNPNYLDLVNMAQAYIESPEMVYKFYYNSLPTKFKFFKWIKGKKDQNKELLTKLTEYYKVSQREVQDYLEILDKDSILDILSKYGMEKKEIKKLLK
jgi:hypothetical protein